MALQKTFTGLDGGAHTNAYHRIVRVVQDKLGHSPVHIIAEIHHDKAARDAGNQHVEIKTWNVPDTATQFTETQIKTDGNSLLGQSYAWLKTRSEYSGATDV
jgi:hypothetical protein